MSGVDTNDGAETGEANADAAQAPDPARVLPPAAQRALAEAEQRRQKLTHNDANKPGEVGGRNGPEPTRFGDWEKNGIASDF